MDPWVGVTQALSAKVVSSTWHALLQTRGGMAIIEKKNYTKDHRVKIKISHEFYNERQRHP